ncbi:TIGR04222 domain-containing membrane protein, partial [Streptomyces sp. NPDC058964]|uniref:TIGR04222 domain-containing membrane protein n=1 Tax=Streptomyces sp. NPDC058964 TaxID=3346681 RepID=UPI0036B5D4C7
MGTFPSRGGPPARGGRPPARGCVMSGASTNRLEPHEIAFVRGGPRAAVTVGVLDLHLRGAVGAGRAGTMRTSGPVTGQTLPPLAKAVHSALYRPAGMRQLLNRQGVRSALADLRGELTAAGLLRPFPPGRTRTARRTLKKLRERHTRPIGRAGLSGVEPLVAGGPVSVRGPSAQRPPLAGVWGVKGGGGG